MTPSMIFFTILSDLAFEIIIDFKCKVRVLFSCLTGNSNYHPHPDEQLSSFSEEDWFDGLADVVFAP